MHAALQNHTTGYKPIQLELVEKSKTVKPDTSKKRHTGGYIGLSGDFTRELVPSIRKAWLAQRNRYFGGSDAGSIMGASKWGSPLTVYGDKLAIIPEPDEEKEEKSYFRRGRVMEPVVMREFKKDWAKIDGRKMRATKYPYFLKSTKHEFMAANLDGLIEIAGMGKGVLEIKTASSIANSVKEWRAGEIPDVYYWQLMHYLAVTGLGYAVIVVWIDGELIYQIVPRNEQRIAELIKAESELWEMIKAKNPPAPEGIEDEDEIIAALNGGKMDGETELDESYTDLFAELAAVKEQIKAAQKLEKQIKQKFQMALDGAKKARCGDHYVTRSRVSTNRFDAKAFKLFDPDLHSKFMKESSYEKLTIK